MLWHLSVAGDLILAIFAVPLLWIEYLLLGPVNKQLVVLAVLFNLVSLAVESVSKLFLLVVMPTLGNGDWPIVATIGGVSSPSGMVLTVQQ